MLWRRKENTMDLKEARMKYLLLLLWVAVLAHPCFAQDTPEEVVSRYFEQLASEGIGQVGSLMHPDELRKFRDMMVPIVDQALKTPDQAALFAAFADSSNGQEVRRFTDEGFMNTFMEWVAMMQPGFTDILKNATIETLGHVEEGDVQHVVVRMTMNVEGLEIEKMSVLSVKDFNGQPRMLLTGEMKGIADALQQQ